MAAKYRYNPRTGTWGRPRKRRKKRGGFSGLGSLGQATTLKGNIKSVQNVLVIGAIAAGGALATEALFNEIESKFPSLNLTGYTKELAKAASGIALGILISKLLKKPQLGAAFAIGPVVAAAMRIFGNLLGTTSGLGLVTIRPVHPGPPLGQLTQITNVPGATPAWMQNPSGRLPTYTGA